MHRYLMHRCRSEHRIGKADDTGDREVAAKCGSKQCPHEAVPDEDGRGRKRKHDIGDPRERVHEKDADAGTGKTERPKPKRNPTTETE